MGSASYRLWQRWQQMKYPLSGLPERESDRSLLIKIDGTVGPVFERTFQRRSNGTLSGKSRQGLERCQRELREMQPLLFGDARRYFDRVEVLIRLVLAES